MELNQQEVAELIAECLETSEETAKREYLSPKHLINGDTCMNTLSKFLTQLELTERIAYVNGSDLLDITKFYINLRYHKILMNTVSLN